MVYRNGNAKKDVYDLMPPTIWGQYLTDNGFPSEWISISLDSVPIEKINSTSFGYDVSRKKEVMILYQTAQPETNEVDNWYQSLSWTDGGMSIYIKSATPSSITGSFKCYVQKKFRDNMLNLYTTGFNIDSANFKLIF